MRSENEELRRRIQQLEAASPNGSHAPAKLWQPSRITIWSIVLIATVALAIAFLAGYIPLHKRNNLIAGEAQQDAAALPRVDVMQVGRSTRDSELELPGNIQAITEAPILARADGYVVHRMVDIGDRVQAGQPLAEIEAPELDEQVQQAKANVQQAQAALDQAQANYEQGKSNMDLARSHGRPLGQPGGAGRGVAAGERSVSGAIAVAGSQFATRSKRPSPRSAAT